MKEKFLQFFTGQMSKSIYISVAAAVVCGAVVITSVVVVHNNNQKIDAVLESLSASESMTESVTETAAESVSCTDNTDVKVLNGEPADDKELQYLVEYEKLTAEYEKKKAELEKQIYDVQKRKVVLQSAGEEPPVSMEYPGSTDIADYSKYKAEFDNSISEEHSIWVERSKLYNEAYQYQSKIAEAEYASEQAQVNDAKRKLNELNAQYEKDVAALKARYGIA